MAAIPRLKLKWAVLLISLLLLGGCGGATAFNVSYLQGCDKSNNLTQLWLNSTGLRGPIPSEIGKCTALQSLSLRGNVNVNGSIPPEIGQLSNLVTLDLGNTGLSGPIPKEFGNLSSLRTLNLGVSLVSGPVPWDALCQMSNLSSLWLNYTKVEGGISAGIGKCAALQGLSLHGSFKVNGSIPPEIGQLTNLTFLDLGSTNLTGPIPTEIGGLSGLTILELGNSNFSAPVPWEGVCQMPNLTSLNLGGNSLLTGPSAPPCFWKLTGLQTLTLSNSPVFNGTDFPVDFCQLLKLKVAYLGGVNLTGPIPACLANISGLQQLALFENGLVGGIPPELGLLQNLSLLRLRDNRLTGNIPVGLRGLSQLTTLAIQNNNLTGPLPAEVFASLGRLSELDLSNNSLTGPIPTEIGASGEALARLDLAHNHLDGSIPPGLGNLSNLTHLDLSYNWLSGALPVELRGLRPSEMGIINLSYNNLTGAVSPIGHLTGLSDIVLNNNNFSGPIPTEWFNSTELQVLNLAFNSFSGPVPVGIRNMAPPDFSAVLSLFFGGLPAFALQILDEIAGSIIIGLNSNQLTGDFPDIGRLNYTASINVSDNNLSGTFHAGPFRKKNVTASFLELSRNGPLDLIPGYNLSGLELLSLPNISAEGLPIVAPQMRALNIAGRGIPPSTKLDLRRVPATCPYVSYAQPAGGVITDVTFWDACDKSLGCVVNLIGTQAKLSRATRERICLGKISVFLEGDSPGVRFSVGGPGSAFLLNGQGSVYFNDSAFVDHLDLGPGGVAYTGVGFARVQEGNLCRNEGAAEVVGITYGVFAALIVVSAVAWWCVRASGVLRKTSGKPSRPRLAAAIGLGVYLWSIVSVLLAWADLVSDVQVVVEIWRVWSTWVILASILAPFVLSGLCAGRVLLEDTNRLSPFKARIKWIPFYNLPEPSDPPPLGALPWWKYALVPITLPATFAYVIFLDCLDLLDKIGGHVRFGPDVYSLSAYSKFRSQLDLTLRSVPQAVFQTALYMLGSSRATRIYIDEQILLRSILLSLLNTLVQFNFLAHECLATRTSVWAILQRRFAARNCRATRLRDAAAADEEADDKLAEKVDNP